MHIHGIPSIWSKFGFGPKPGEERARGGDAVSESVAEADLRFVRRQLVMLRRAFGQLGRERSSDPESDASQARRGPTLDQLSPAPDTAAFTSTATTDPLGAQASDIEAAINALFDDFRLIGKPGPLLKVLRDSIRSAVTSVFNNRGPGFVPPFRFGFNFLEDPMSPESLETALLPPPLVERDISPEAVHEFLYGDPAHGKVGLVDELLTELERADQLLADVIGDQGIFVDELV